MPPAITTERLILRPFSEADVDAVVDILGTFEVSKWLAKVSHPFTRDDVRLKKDDGSSRWPDLMAITLDGKVIGGISGVPHIGYYLAPEHWGQGYAREAVEAVLDHVFDVLGHDKVESGVFQGNGASHRILEQLGFRQIGSGKEHCKARNCDLDHIEYALTKAEWEARVQ